LTRLHPAFSPFGLPVHLIASPHFDELRRPANLALQVTINVITRPIPLAAVLIRSLQLIQTFGLPSAAPGAASELVVLVLNGMLNLVSEA